MSRHEPSVRLRHMLKAAKQAVAMAEGKRVDDLRADAALGLALERLIEIVGEAASWLPEELRARHPVIPWRDIKDMRNRLIHGYDTIDVALVWNTVTEDLPPLVAALEAILQEQAP
ncbi:MAG: DUF86 domain-containing protein [Deltaproteobacteria bacterium]|nr:DUF86 domain-containing protein [Deltaproteobacteria bacterium]